MKSTQKFTLLFRHRKSKTDNRGFTPVICRISIYGDDEEQAIGRSIYVDHWNVEFKQAFGALMRKNKPEDQ